MECESVRQILLELGTDDAFRANALRALQHLQSCPSCQAAAREYDGISAALALPADVAVPIGGWQPFERHLQASLPRPRSRQPALWIMGIAASVLLAVGAFQIGRHQRATTAALPVEAMVFTPRDLPTDVSAFEQVSKVFDGRAKWLVVSKDASDIGIASDSMAPAHRVLLVHLSVSHVLTTVSDTDLMILPGQTADLNVPLGEGQSLHYRIGASLREPTRLAIWLEVVTARGGQTIGALATTLQVHPGQKLDAGQLVTSTGEYQLKVGFAQSELGTNP